MESIRPQHPAQEFLIRKEALVKKELDSGFGVHTTKRYTALVDDFLKHLIIKSGLKGPGGPEGFLQTFAIVATGSYGRRELCFGSDIDLIIVHEKELCDASRKAIAKALYPLWDGHLELGYTFLTADECMNLAREEISVLTAVMESRRVVGSKRLFRLFNEHVWEGMREDRKSILERLLLYNEKRNKKYDRVDYFLEPEIKEGLGGLRDLHFMGWIARLYLGVEKLGHIKRLPEFSHFGFSQLIYSKRFLLNIRNHLHLMRGRREDRLNILNQKEITRILGYNDRPYSTGPERFMRNLYLHLNRVRYGREEFLNKALDMVMPLPPDPALGRVSDGFLVHKGNVVLKDEGLEGKDPIMVLEAFKDANELGLFLGSGFIWEARKVLLFQGKRLAEKEEAKNLFLDLILHPQNAKIIRLALEIGLIGLFIPEFNRIRNLAQFGYYHVETIDLHALTTLQVLNDLSNGVLDESWPRFSSVFKEVTDRDSLYLAALIHDIGKAYRGNHSKNGARIVPRILERLGIGEGQIKTVSFLVENHHLLVDTSQKGDLNYEKTTVTIAQVIQSRERLNLLFLLTVADCYSTGPTASSDWKIMLLVELYTKVRNILERGHLASPDATTKVSKKKERLYKKIIRDFPKKSILELMEQASTRYFLNTPVQDIERHFRLALRMGKNKFKWRLTKLKTAPVTQVNLCAMDRPGLFSRMVGVFACNNINVLYASISTLKNGMAFDIYRVTNPVDPLREKEIWAKTKEEALEAIDAGEEFDVQIEKRLLRNLDATERGYYRFQKIHIDNDVSDFFTCIEVSASSGVGLLYKLAREMFALDLNIRFASVMSEKGRTTGVFHVRDNRGQKIHETLRIKGIQETLWGVIS